ncbi:MAG: SMC-Scp complex subunit ScpB [Nitrospirae bacterium RBG_16_64_22]|nr:MAG: SMC-Scp complex subunit ScpB [Nitrospirae bacterium RBG_16_64_22]
MTRSEIRAVLEAFLFVAPEPLSVDRMADLFDGVDREEVREALTEVRDELEVRDSGLHVVEVAGGWQMVTRPQYAPWVRRLLSKTPARLSRAGLETLAIVAYRQPVTRAEVEQVRGVDCGGALKTLLERRLVRMLGRMDVAGRPIMYGTTQEFLQYFGLKDLSQLPSLKEFQDMADAELPLELPFGEAEGKEGGEAAPPAEERSAPAPSDSGDPGEKCAGEA